jgi:hypothetical protein
VAVFPCAMLLFWIERCRIRWLCLSPPPFPHLILLNEQICCCGTAERCTATLRLHHSPISSPCQRRSSGSKQQRSPATSFACVVTCAWSPDPTQQPTSFAQKLKCSQTGAKTPYDALSFPASLNLPPSPPPTPVSQRRTGPHTRAAIWTTMPLSTLISCPPGSAISSAALRAFSAAAC